MQASKRGLLSSRKIWFFILPSLVGMSVFYFIPALVSLFYAFTDVRGTFVWFSNFLDVLTNSAFLLATRNTVMFIAVSVPLNMAIAFLLAGLCQKLRYKKVYAVVFMLPLIIPSGAVVFFWRSIFADNGLINRILLLNGMEPTFWFSTSWTFGIVVLVFLFKYIGFNLVLFMAGYQLIPKDYYEVARVEGAGVFQIFRHVTSVYMLPTTFLVLIMSVINSFKIFRELFLLFGHYPHGSIYMLQHFMNNQFVAANLQRLSVTAMVLSAAVLILVMGVFTVQKKVGGWTER